MRIQKTHAAALALAGALAVASATPSLADSRWGYAAGGFAAGALVGAAAAHSADWGPGYAYHPGYQGYALAPARTVVAPSTTLVAPAPGYMAYGYAPGFSTFSYGPTFDPENGSDPDPRIGGSFRMNSSRDD